MRRENGQRRAAHAKRDRDWQALRIMIAEARLYEPITPATVATGPSKTGQKSFFYVRSCLDCGIDSFGKGRDLCRRCANKRRRSPAKSQQARARHFGVERESNLHWRRLYEEDGPFCRICLFPVVLDAGNGDPCGPTMDHIIPMVKGGSHTRANVQLAHMACNSHKLDRTDGIFSGGKGSFYSVVPRDWVNWDCARHSRPA